MASLENRNGSYRVVFRYAGRKFSRSLETSHLIEARASVARLEDNLRRLELGLLLLPEGVDLAAFLLSDGRIVSKPRVSGIQTLEELLHCYFAQVPAGSLEESTLYGMHIHANHLYRILGRRAGLEDLSTASLQAYIIKRGKAKTKSKRLISPATIKKELITLRTVWNWGIAMGHITRSFPGRGLKYPKLEAKPPFRTLGEIEKRLARGGMSKEMEDRLWESAFLSLQEIDALLSHVKSTSLEPYLYPMFVFAAHSGARRSEMLRSEIDDFDFQNGVVLIRERKRVRGTKSTRAVPLSAQLQKVLADWLKNHPGGDFTLVAKSRQGACKYSGRGSLPLTPDVCHKHFKQVLSGTRFEKLRGWHVLRHSFCSNCAARGIDQRVINAWVGHQSEEMVRRYRHLLPSQSRESIELVFGKGD